MKVQSHVSSIKKATVWGKKKIVGEVNVRADVG